MKPKLFLAVSIVVILSLLAACSSFAKKNTPTPLPTPTPTSTPFPTSFEKMFEVNGHMLHIYCEGQGEPTIILENGLGGPSFGNVKFLIYNRISRTCTYLRAMGGQVTEARTTEDQVKDLYDLLAQAGIPGPYVLVGHSIAGYNLVLYAYHYPEETVGLVCVDCRAPMFDKDFMDAMGEEQPDESQEIKDARKELTVGLENAEYLDMVASAAQAQKVASLGNVPLVVLVAEKTLTPDPPAGPLDILGGKIWLKSNEELAKLSSRGRIEIVPGVNHGMIITSDALTKAIQEVVDAARQAP